jgi:basic membrane protein A and related proteins
MMLSMQNLRWLWCLSLMPLLALPAFAAPAAKPALPALVYVLTTDSDGAFVDAARKGAAKARHDFTIQYSEHNVRSSDTIAVQLEKLAKAGSNPIIAVGYQNVLPVLNLAEKYPRTHFVVIDGLVPPLFPNVQSIIFKDHEGAFLVGMLAAYASKSGHIGFIGGMDIPLIRNFAHGFSQGIHYVNKNATLSMDMVGRDQSAWSNTTRAEAIAKQQFSDGIDVIFAAAGGAGMGVLKAAHASSNLAIGVDSNQNGSYPGSVLTSMIKRVDVAVYKTLKATQRAQWSPGIKYLGIYDGALDFAVDSNNRNLLNETMLNHVADAKERIMNGFLEVEMYNPR